MVYTKEYKPSNTRLWCLMHRWALFDGIQYAFFFHIYVRNITEGENIGSAFALGPRQQSVKVLESGLSAVKLVAQRYTCTSVTCMCTHVVMGIGNEVRGRKHTKGKKSKNMAAFK